MTGEPEPAVNQRYGYFRSNVSDTGNDFSSIIRGLIDIVRRYSTFKRNRNAWRRDRYKWHLVQREIKFALYNHISIATLDIPPLRTFTSVGLGAARSLKHHCTANMEVCDTTQNIEHVLGTGSRL